MTTLPLLAASLFAICLSSFGSEPNPFLNSPPEKPAVGPSGDSFVSLTEHILVPADQLDGWLRDHPMTDDASALREVAQTWVAAGTADLDQTAVSTGIAGRESTNSSIWSQIYATEYEPPGPGEWPVPTAFDTRNLGYQWTGSAASVQGATTLRAKMSYVGMLLSQHAWNELAERTRKPGDIFIPRFRSINVAGKERQSPGDPAPADPFADPFAEPVPRPVGWDQLRFEPGKTYLVSRQDNEVPTAVGNPPGRLVRLIFFRGAIITPPSAREPNAPEIRHLSAKLIKVKHRTLSDWLQTEKLTEIPVSAWAAAENWVQKGDAEVISTVTAPNNPEAASIADSCVEVIYPTEWEPGKRLPASEGKPSQLEFSTAAAFETRNVGTTFQFEIQPDPSGAILHSLLERGVEGEKSVLYRILRDGEWKADITFPVFGTNSWITDLRVERGVWLLVGSGSNFDAKGKPDSQNSVLAFIRMD